MNNKKSKMNVSSEKIRYKADSARLICINILTRIKEIEKNVEKSSYFWDSDGSALLKKYLNEDMIDYEKIKKQLNTQIDNLYKIGKTYEITESFIESSSIKLPDTVLD